MCFTFVLLAASASVVPCVALAHHQEVHAWAESFLVPDSTELTVPSEGDLERFRHFLYDVWSKSPVIGSRFKKLYPTFTSFDAREFKRFLGLSLEHPVPGIDVVGPVLDSLRLAQWACAQPDEGMNQDNWLYDDSGGLITDRWGRPVPFDPASAQMGGISGLVSQAYAHYQLCPGPKTDDFDILASHPERFASPPDVKTYAAHFAQVFADLAVLARMSDSPASRYLYVLFRGYSHHFILDGSDHFHTVQVGSRKFFVDALKQSLWFNTISAGGLFFRVPSLVTIGVRIISNHHLLGENLYAAWLSGMIPRDGIHDRAQEALKEGDSILKRRMKALGCPSPAAECTFLGTMLASSLSCTDARQAYELVSELAVPEISSWDVKVPDSLDAVRKYIVWPVPVEQADHFEKLMNQSMARFSVVVRITDQSLEEVISHQEVLTVAVRLGKRLMDYQEDCRQRRASYVPQPPEKTGVNWWYPAAELWFINLLLLIYPLRRIIISGRKRTSS